MFEDKTLKCVDCGKDFTFSADEQEFFAERGFQNEPKRCLECRSEKRRSRRTTRHEREMYEVVCDDCGKHCKVPFMPRGDRPVYCDECYSSKNSR